jgi:hypothetical protein
MKTLFDEAQTLVHQFDEVKIEHNLRHKNELADELLNLSLDRKADVTEAGGAARSPLDEPTPASFNAGDRVACPRCRCVIEIRTPSSIRPHQLKPFVCQCGAKMSGL